MKKLIKIIAVFISVLFISLMINTSVSAQYEQKKADAMCNMMSKEKMPPKKYRDNHQSDIPTKHEINKVCDWAQSLQEYRK